MPLNAKFFDLPKERQVAIIHAGCEVFAQYGYKKSPMSEIALEAGISKALLFHYFKNKKEYYLYLFNYSANLMLETVRSQDVVSSKDLFGIFKESLRWKCDFVRRHARIAKFLFKTSAEDDPEVVSELNAANYSFTRQSVDSIYGLIEKSKFRDGVDIKRLIRMCVWCGEGYKQELFGKTPVDIDAYQTGYEAILDQFRRLSYREEHWQ